MLKTKYNFIIYSALVAFGFSVFVRGYIDYRFIPEPIKTSSYLATKVDEPREEFDKELVFNKNIFDLEVISAAQVGSNGSVGGKTGTTPANNSMGQSASINTPIKSEEEFEGKLLGVLVGDDIFLAIVKFKGDVRILRKGVPQSGLELVDVFPDSVNIKYANDIYSLTFPEEEVAGISRTESSKGNDSEESDGGLRYEISKQFLTRQLQDMNSILRTVFISPYYDNGNFVGYRISRLADSSPLKQVGIRQGDILVQINGETLDSPNKMLELFSKIDDLTAAKIDILRKGERKTLFVEVKS